MEKTILSIDCGTQSLRAILFSLKGEVLGIYKIPFQPYLSPKPGWAEQDPEVYWESLKMACKFLKREYPEAFSGIAGVGVAALRNSMVNVDRNGNPLRPIIVWLDQRKAEPVYRPGIGNSILIYTIGLYRSLKMAQREGKCNWIKQNQPNIWENTHKYLQVSGFLNYRLTGEFRDSVASQIGHIPFDYQKQQWGDPNDRFQFTSRIYPVEKEKLPELVWPGNVIGKVTRKAGAETGLPVNLPVIACGSDKGCETLGMGVLTEDMASLSLGTTATIQTTSRKYFEPVPFMPAYPAVIPGFFNPEVEIFRGFWMISWFKDEFSHKEVEIALTRNIPPEQLLDRFLTKSPPGSKGLVVQPYWGPGLSNPTAKGSIIGFGDVHKKQHIYRSVVEGLVYALREGKEKIEKVSREKVRKLAVSGGASQSDEICRIAADIFNLPLVRGRTVETSGLGAAMITAYGTGNYDTIEEAIAEMVHYADEFHPNSENAELYDKLYKKVYLKIYKKMAPLYNNIQKITGYPE